jgi:hypothetical protein
MAGTQKNSVLMSVFCKAGEFQFLISLLCMKEELIRSRLPERPKELATAD